jgi:hypothetical protein
VGGEELERADASTIRRLLTLMVRKDRFVEGTIADAFKAGLVVRILRRLESLTSQGELA